MKTVVTEILEELKRHGIEHTEEQRNRYLEAEKQQIIDAYIEGHTTMQGAGCSHTYYEQTYTTNKETLK